MSAENLRTQYNSTPETSTERQLLQSNYDVCSGSRFGKQQQRDCAHGRFSPIFSFLFFFALCSMLLSCCSAVLSCSVPLTRSLQTCYPDGGFVASSNTSVQGAFANNPPQNYQVNCQKPTQNLIIDYQANYKSTLEDSALISNLLTTCFILTFPHFIFLGPDPLILPPQHGETTVAIEQTYFIHSFSLRHDDMLSPLVSSFRLADPLSCFLFSGKMPVRLLTPSPIDLSLSRQHCMRRQLGQKAPLVPAHVARVGSMVKGAKNNADLKAVSQVYDKYGLDKHVNSRVFHYAVHGISAKLKESFGEFPATIEIGNISRTAPETKSEGAVQRVIINALNSRMPGETPHYIDRESVKKRRYLSTALSFFLESSLLGLDTTSPLYHKYHQMSTTEIIVLPQGLNQHTPCTVDHKKTCCLPLTLLEVQCFTRHDPCQTTCENTLQKAEEKIYCISMEPCRVWTEENQIGITILKSSSTRIPKRNYFYHPKKNIDALLCYSANRLWEAPPCAWDWRAVDAMPSRLGGDLLGGPLQLGAATAQGSDSLSWLWSCRGFEGGELFENRSCLWGFLDSGVSTGNSFSVTTLDLANVNSGRNRLLASLDIFVASNDSIVYHWYSIDFKGLLHSSGQLFELLGCKVVEITVAVILVCSGILVLIPTLVTALAVVKSICRKAHAHQKRARKNKSMVVALTTVLFLSLIWLTYHRYPTRTPGSHKVLNHTSTSEQCDAWEGLYHTLKFGITFFAGSYLIHAQQYHRFPRKCYIYPTRLIFRAQCRAGRYGHRKNARTAKTVHLMIEMYKETSIGAKSVYYALSSILYSATKYFLLLVCLSQYLKTDKNTNGSLLQMNRALNSLNIQHWPHQIGQLMKCTSTVSTAPNIVVMGFSLMCMGWSLYSHLNTYTQYRKDRSSHIKQLQQIASHRIISILLREANKDFRERSKMPKEQLGGGPKKIAGTPNWSKAQTTTKKGKNITPLADDNASHWTKNTRKWLSNWELRDFIKLVLEPVWGNNRQMLVGRHSIPYSDSELVEGLTHVANRVALSSSNLVLQSMQTHNISPYFITNPGGEHWRLILIDNRTKHIYYIDPLGRNPEYPNPLVDHAVQERIGGGFTSSINTEIYQTDGYNCGIWSLYITEIWAEYLQEESTEDFLSYLSSKTRERGLFQRGAGDSLRQNYASRYNNLSIHSPSIVPPPKQYRNWLEIHGTRVHTDFLDTQEQASQVKDILLMLLDRHSEMEKPAETYSHPSFRVMVNHAREYLSTQIPQQIQRHTEFEAQPQDVPGDGNCLFSAISFFMHTDITHERGIRLAIVEHICDHWPGFEEETLFNYADKGVTSLETYKKYMSTPRTWAGPPEARAAAALWNIGISLWDRNYNVKLYAYNPESPIQYNFNFTGSHFQCLIPKARLTGHRHQPPLPAAPPPSTKHTLHRCGHNKILRGTHLKKSPENLPLGVDGSQAKGSKSRDAQTQCNQEQTRTVAGGPHEDKGAEYTKTNSSDSRPTSIKEPPKLTASQPESTESKQRKNIEPIDRDSVHQGGLERSKKKRKLKQQQITGFTTNKKKPGDGALQEDPLEDTDTPKGLPKPTNTPLKILTWNVMGLTTVQQEIATLIEIQDPDIIVLTETKLVKEQNCKRWVHDIFPGYKLQASSKPSQKLVGKDAGFAKMRNGAGGVLVAVKDSLTHRGTLQQLQTPEGCQGHLTGIQLHPPCDSKPITIWGVYMPSENSQTREHVYLQLANVLKSNTNANTILAGDWNAVLRDTDRNTDRCTSMDKKHIEFVQQHQLISQDCPPCSLSHRSPTFFAHSIPTSWSRIDDILITQSISSALNAYGQADCTAPYQRVLHTSDDSDHLPVIIELPLQVVGFRRPDPDPPAKIRTPRFCMPMKNTELEAFRIETDLKCATEIYALHCLSESIIKEMDDHISKERLKNPSIDTKTALHNRGFNAISTLEMLDCKLYTILNTALAMARETCKQTKPTTKCKKGNNRFMDRTTAHLYRSLLKKSSGLKLALDEHIYNKRAAQTDKKTGGEASPLPNQQATEKPQEDDPIQTQPTPKKREGQETQQTPPPGGPREDNDWEQETRATLASLKQKRKNIRLNQISISRAQYRSAMRKLLSTKPKAGHKIINNPTHTRHDINAVRDSSTGQILQDTKDVLEHTFDYFAKQATPVTGPKTGLFLPKDSPRKYPWGDTPKLDEYTLESKVGDPAYGAMDLQGMMRDRSTYQRTVRGLAKGKAPGPDELPNELLQNLPDDLQTSIHNIMIIMWLAGVTPNSWKTSTTVLVYKKGDPLDLKNHRPIGLMNTIYKAWTSLITEVLSTFAEHYQILSNSQEGFRKNKNTVRQLQNVVNMLSDARLTNQNIYLLFIDFSSAFNTIDHDKLLQTMYDLGFPIDAIHVIQNLYLNVTTKVQLACGETGPIDIQRGTIQGDTLSPFLFSVFVEPLLRWLQSGGRGYKYGCLQAAPEHANHTTSSAAYADDLMAATNSTTHLRLQAEKIDRFCIWSGLETNPSKCGTTAVLYKDADSGLIKHPFKNTDMMKKRLESIKLKGAAVPFYDPDKEPYTYLGIELTATLNWAPQMAKVIKETTRRGDNIQKSFASPLQCLQFIHRCIKPYITYSFPLAMYSTQDIAKLDGLISRIAKRSMQLPLGTPTALVLEHRNRAGMGVTSLMVDYIQSNTSYLVKALNDEGPLGMITRSLIQLQHQHLGGLDPMTGHAHKVRFMGEAKYCHLVKQLSLMQAAKLELISPDNQSAIPWSQLGEKTQLAKLLKSIPYDPLDLGEELVIPARILLPLFELGITTLSSLLCKNMTTHIIDTKDLTLRYGPKVTSKHMVALNRLTIILQDPQQKDPVTPQNPLTYTSPAALPSAKRKINPAHLQTKLLNHTIEADWTPASPNIRQLTYAMKGKKPIPEDEGSCKKDIPEIDLTRPDRKKQKVRKGQPSRPEYRRRIFAEEETATNSSGMQRDDVTHGYTEMQTEEDKECREEARLSTFEHQLWQTQHERYLQGEFKEIYRKPKRKKNQAPRKKSGKGGRLSDNTEPKANALMNPVAFKKFVRNKTLRPELFRLLYTEQEQPIALTECRLVNGQEQFLVDWAPMYLLNRHIKEYNTDDYTITSTTRCTKYGTVLAKKLSKVTWASTWEPTANLIKSADTQEMIATFRRKKSTANEMNTHRKYPARRDLQKSNLHQQCGYIPPCEHRCNERLSARPNLRQYITFQTTAINPDEDIVPTGKYEISTHNVVEDSEMESPELTGEHGCSQNPWMQLAKIYSPAGRFLGKISVTRLEVLHAAFESSKKTRPHLHNKFEVRSFEEEVARLLHRYKNGYTHYATGSETKISNHWATPDEYMEALITGLALTTERFASPLNFNPKMQSYFSLYPEDQVFGASWDAYSCKWLGASQSNPEYEADEMEKAVRWALLSCEATEEPSLTAFILPDWGTTGNAYQKWLSHPMAHMLVKVPRNQFKFKTPQHWCTGKLYAGHPKWDVNIFVIANPQGIERYLDRDSLIAGIEHASTTVGNRTITPDLPRPHELSHEGQAYITENLYQTKAYRTITEQNNEGESYETAPWKAPTVQEEASDINFSTELPKKYVAGNIVYTDGSCKEIEGRGQVTGAGVYREEPSIELTVDTMAGGCINTITRAELCAILVAVQVGDQPIETIATDSLASIHIISKHLDNPISHRYYKHRELLDEIVTALLDRAQNGHQTNFVKVKSHTGIVGNDHADRLANEACEKEGCGTSVQAGIDPYRTLFCWLQTSKVIPGQEEPVDWLLSNLCDDIKSVAGDLHNKGFSNQDTIYNKSWSSAQKDILQGHSNKFWAKPGDIKTKMIINTLKYRYGQLWNKKKAYLQHSRYPNPKTSKPATNMQCPLCTEPDSGGHMLGGCLHPEMKKAYISRHDTALRTVLKAINVGDHGSYYMIADIGSAQNTKDLGVHAKRVPTWILPETGEHRSRPDIMLVEMTTETLNACLSHNNPPDLSANIGDKQRKIWIVEGGYCGDTRMPEKVTEKQNQHACLVERLEERGYAVKYMVFPMGVGGTLYKTNHESLLELGIQRKQADKVLGKIHIHSIHCLHNIVKQRRFLESQSTTPTRWNPP